MTKKTKEAAEGNILVIVESPTKAKTIAKFLGSDYVIDSSFGHVRDLPKGNLGVDTENDFEPKYVIPTKSRKQVNKLKKEAAKAREVILATDEDREGEAIAYHLTEALDLDKKMMAGEVKRIVFHEITEAAIKKALDSPRGINQNMVNAQQARRVLDRLVGYKLSPFLWQKVRRGLSAGRVQSVAVRLITEKEEEIRKFKPVEYYSLKSLMKIEDVEEAVEFELTKIKGKAIAKPGILNKEEAERAKEDIEKGKGEIAEVKSKEMKKQPLSPFITSTLQQEAAKRLYFSAKKTMMMAQRLYEEGHITYMRTDSVNLSTEAIAGARSFIKKNYGEKYVWEAGRRFNQKSKLAQEAHEAIRPTKPEKRPEDLSVKEKDMGRLYDLIWRRFTASQMTPAIMAATSVAAEIKNEKRSYTLKANGNRIVFEGFLKVWQANVTEKILPEIEEGKGAVATKVEMGKHSTEPPARFNEASLIKALEENGIGRPSTYASIISVIQVRGYVEKNEQRKFQPTELGEAINKLLTEHFPKIVDIGFTADVEEEFDEIALGVSKWKEVIKSFYDPFMERLNAKMEEVKKGEVLPEEETDEKCEQCGKQMAVKYGRFGKFLACTGFPECRNTKKMEGGGGANNGFVSEKTGVKCPECKEGELVSRRVSKGRARGKVFWGCNKYPECKHAVWEKPTTTNN